MKTLFWLVTFTIILLNITCLVHYLPHAIRVNNSEFDKVIEGSTKDSKELRQISQQILMDYPDLPRKVKVVLEEFPEISAGRANSIQLLSNSSKGFVTLLAFNSFFFVIWVLVAAVYYRAGGFRFGASGEEKAQN